MEQNISVQSLQIRLSFVSASNPGDMIQVMNPNIVKKQQNLIQNRINLQKKLAQLEKINKQKQIEQIQRKKREKQFQIQRRQIQKIKQRQEERLREQNRIKQERLREQNRIKQERLREQNRIKQNKRIENQRRMKQQCQGQHLLLFNQEIQVQYYDLKLQCYDKNSTLIDQENLKVLSQYKDFFQPCKSIQAFKKKNIKLQQLKVFYCSNNNICAQYKDIACRSYYSMCKCDKCCDQRVCKNWLNCFCCIAVCSWHILMCATCSFISLPCCISDYQKWKRQCLGGCLKCDSNQFCCTKGLQYFLSFIGKLPSCICQSLQNIAQCHQFIFGNVFMNLAECSSVVFCNTYNCLVNIGRNIGNCCKVVCCGKEKVLLKLKEVYLKYEEQLVYGTKK